jgi:hypothetical protein
MIAVIIRHYIFCSIGAAFRFLIEKMKSLGSKKQTLTFKEVYDYKKHPEN